MAARFGNDWNCLNVFLWNLSNNNNNRNLPYRIVGPAEPARTDNSVWEIATTVVNAQNVYDEKYNT